MSSSASTRPGPIWPPSARGVNHRPLPLALQLRAQEVDEVGRDEVVPVALALRVVGPVDDRGDDLGFWDRRYR